MASTANVNFSQFWRLWSKVKVKRSEVKVPADLVLVSGVVPLPGLQVVTFLLKPHVAEGSFLTCLLLRT